MNVATTTTTETADAGAPEAHTAAAHDPRWTDADGVVRDGAGYCVDCWGSGVVGPDRCPCANAEARAAAVRRVLAPVNFDDSEVSF